MDKGVRWIAIGILLSAIPMAAYPCSAKTTTITYACWGGGEQDKPLLQRFMEINPDIKVRMIPSNTDVGPYLEKVLIATAGGMAPDALLLNHGIIDAAQQSGLLQPLNAMVKRDKVDLRNWFTGYVDLFGFPEGQLALPLTVGSLSLFYKEKQLAMAGLESLQNVAYTDKWNRTTYTDYIRKLTRDGNGDGKPEVYGMGDVPAWIWESLLRQDGGHLYSPDGKRCTINSAAGATTFGFIHYLRQVARAWNPKDSWDSICDKSNATQFTGGWVIPYLLQAKVNDFNIVPFFRGKHDGFLTPDGNGIGISKNSKNKEAAWRFVRFMATEGSMMYAKGGIATPALKSIANDHSWANRYPGKNLRATLDSLGYTKPEQPRSVKRQKLVSQTLYEYLNPFFYKGKGVAETLSAAESAVNRLLGR